jgi:hypothetical protein
MVGDCFTTSCADLINNLLCGAGVRASTVNGTTEVIDHDERSA